MTADERVSATWALLRSYADWMPTTVKVWQPADLVRGEAPGREIECPTCGGMGRMSRGKLACRHCSGKGRVWIDPQTEHEVVAEDTTYEKLIRYRRVNCDGCGGSGRVSASSRRDPGFRDVLEVDGDRHWWREAERERCSPCRGSGSVEVVDERLTDASLRQIARDQAARAGEVASEEHLDLLIRRQHEQWATGSYREFANVLRSLETRAPRLHAALMRHVVYEPGEYAVSEAIWDRLDDVVEWIAEQMPERIRVPKRADSKPSRKHVAWRHRSPAAEQHRRRRDGEIAALVLDHGQAPEHVADIHGLSSRRVRQIVASAAASPALDPAAVATFAL